MKKIQLALAIAITVGTACNSGTTINGKDPKDSSQKAEMAAEKDSGTLNKVPIATTTNSFATHAAIGGMMEVESSTNMIKSTENPDIQTLATIMVKDHGMANRELNDLAKKMGIQLPTTLPKEKMDILAKLAPLKEDEKNLFYASLMVKEHQEAVVLFEEASKNETGELKIFATRKLSILKHHLMEALNVQKIMNSIKGDKGDQSLKMTKERQ